MNQAINDCLAGLNGIGKTFCSHAAGAFVQSALLVILLFAIDLLLRKRVRAVFRYCVWLLVLVKLVLPPTLSLPSGVGYWVPERVPAASFLSERVSDTLGDEPARPRRYAGPEPSSEIPQVQPPANMAQTDAAVPPAASSLTPITWQAVVFLLWLVGVLAFGLLLAQRLRFVRGLVAASIPAGGEQLGLLEQCRRQMSVRRQVGLRTLDTVPSPAVCGLRRPIILMPTSLVERLSPEGLRAALIHEFAHIKRADLWVNAVQTFLQVVYFYNPFVWFANAIIRRTCEEAVDETVLVTLGGQAKSYSNTLIDISEMAFWKADFGLRLVGVAESRKALQGRIKHMLTRPVPKSARIGALGTIAILVVAAVLLPMARAERSNKDAPTTPSATAAETTEQAPPAAESDTLVDPNTGLKFTVAKRISGENDVIYGNDGLSLSLNGKFLLRGSQVVPLDGGKAFELEALRAGQGNAAWSPDGKLIAYRSAATSAVWLLPVSPETGQSTGPARKLIDDPANWSYGVILWSADSEWIILCYYEQGNRLPTERCISVRDGKLVRPPDYTRFSLRSPDQKSFAYFRPRNSIWAAPLEGRATRLVAGISRWGIGTVPLWWSPDGEWLLCGGSRRGYSYDNVIFVRLADRREVALKFPEQVRDAEFPAVALGVSPDGKKLQFFKNSHRLRHVTKVAPIRGGGFAEVPFSRQFVYIEIQEARAPKDGGLVFVGYKQDGWALCVAPAGGGDPVEVKMNVSLDGMLSPWQVSPDGRQFLAAIHTIREQGVFRDFYVIPISLEEAQSTGPATLIFKDWQPPKGGGESFAWSPDSSRLAICAKGEGNDDLWVVPADGSPPQKLTQIAEKAQQSPTWSPDGEYIAYCSVSAGQISLYTIPAEGGAPKRLWTEAGKHTPYAWFPDSKEIGLDCNGLVAVAIANGSVRPFLKLAEVGLDGLYWVQWSPDGQTLALWGSSDQGWRTALFRASDRKVEMLPPDPTWKDGLGWTADSQALFCVAEQNEKVRPAALVYEVDLVEVWTQAKNSQVGGSSPASAPPIARSEAPPLINGEFRDDFDDGDTPYWTFDDIEWEGPGRVREVRNGELALENTRAVLGLPDWTNYVVTVKMCIKQVIPTRFDGGSAAGIGLRKGDHGEYWLGAEPGRKDLGHEKMLGLEIIYRGADNWPRVGALATPPYNFVPGQWYTLQVEVNGPHIVARVDGQTIIDLNDESCPHGAVTLFSVEALAHFDDFSVRLLP